MTDLLAGSDSDVEGEHSFKINESYAANYGLWREKEYMQQLKDKQKRFAIDDDEDEDESSEEDEDAKDLPKLERGFFKALSYLKRKDPRIYDQNVRFFPDSSSITDHQNQENKSKKKDKPFLIRDYERHIILEKQGKLSEDDETPENDPRASSPTYVEEQKQLRESFKHVLQNSDEEDENNLGQLFKKKEKSKAEIEKEEEDYREWLKGRKEQLADKDTESDLRGLHDYWNDPNLSSEEAYLKDYLLNKRFLDPEDEDFHPEFNEMVHDSCPLETDEQNVEAMDNFERKYNFRFEEPDSEYIKSYPRTVETSLRRKDDRRSRKRRELRERKEAEMAAKREEIKQLKAMKRKEILAKIEQIKKITGNEDVNLNEEDFEDDFSPEKHDQKMKELFNDDYYQVEEEEKPECLELEKDLEIEDWENWQGNDADSQKHDENGENWYEPEAENGTFIMDCDYDPKAALQEELKRMSKSKKKQKRKSKFAEAIAKEKPVFDPNDTNFENYFDEYYKLDCEDIIGDLPCRFKYRKTTPNNYGLTVDEILRADVKELNKWCSLKKVVKYKPENVEKYEVQAYKQKAHNEALKRKILPSLYQRDSDSIQMNGEDNQKKKKKKKKQQQTSSAGKESLHDTDVNTELPEKEKVAKERGKKRKLQETKNIDLHSFDTEFKHDESNTFLSKDTDNKFAEVKKIELRNENDFDAGESVCNKNNNSTMKQTPETNNLFKKSKKNFQNNWSPYKNVNNKIKRKNRNFPQSDVVPISDVRLKAYGIRPKKFRNKMKYGNGNNKWNNE